MGLLDKLFGGNKKDKGGSSSGKESFSSTKELLDEEKFWNIIQLTKDRSGNDYEQQQKELANELRKLIPDEIILFDNRFSFFRGRANTWQLWGAIYIIQGGCGDDSFNDFREWVIAQGKIFYYKITDDPESLIDYDTDKMCEIEWEGLGYVASAIFEEKTGSEMPDSYEEQIETSGIKWEEESDDLKNMFPKLSSKFPHHF